ncbi:MAG: TetR/AcrR family transcriptional regulator [Chloroflexota bacterium]|nr:TetR/AcrR family transcriptional regulator [Chloroflexota bacterium]
MKTKDFDQKQDIQTQQLLIEAGIQLIGEKGYDGAAIGDIVALAEVTKGALYYHFGSKENYVLEIIRQRAEQNIARFKQLDKDNISLAEWIERSFSAIIGFSDPAQQLFSLQVMMAGLRPGNERIGALVAEIHADWRRLITEMVILSDEYRKGQLVGEPEVIAVGVMALIDGLLIHFRIEPERFTEQAFIERLAPLLKLWVLKPPVDLKPEQAQ